MDNDLTNKYVIVKALALADAFRKPEFQVFKVTGGFGATGSSFSSRGGKAFGTFAHDDQDGYVYRADIERLATDEEVQKAKAKCACSGSKHN